jgi:quercetin dioxygenase-like cupin family protein
MGSSALSEGRMRLGGWIGIGLWAAAAPAPAKTPLASPAVVVTARIDLGREFPQMKGYAFSQSLLTAPPGAGRGMHSHADFPEVLRILSGVLTETLADGSRLTHGPGETFVSAAGLQHAWANEGTEPLVFVATSIRAVP